MRPIQTFYKGYKFRSRLEARWAVFFDALGIKWEYEPEGYHLSNGDMYLPDFFLPKFCGPKGIYAEVKPERCIDPKAEQLARESGVSVLMVCGMPGPMTYQLINGEPPYTNAAFMGRRMTSEEYRLFYEPGSEDDEGRIAESDLDRSVLEAIVRARSARFEHGEKGATL
jgi:hypothetical protein